MALRRAVKISAAAAAAAAASDNFGWLGGAPSVFRRRRRHSAAQGSTLSTKLTKHRTFKVMLILSLTNNV